MDICEYTDIICPVCKRDKKLEEKGRALSYELGEWVHIVACDDCQVVIYLPCED